MQAFVSFEVHTDLITIVAKLRRSTGVLIQALSRACAPHHVQAGPPRAQRVEGREALAAARALDAGAMLQAAQAAGQLKARLRTTTPPRLSGLSPCVHLQVLP